MAKSKDQSASKMSSDDKEILGGVLFVVLANIVSLGLVILGAVLLFNSYESSWSNHGFLIGGIFAIIVGLIVAVWLLIAAEGMSWIAAPFLIFSLS